MSSEAIARDLDYGWRELLPSTVWTSTAVIGDHLDAITEKDRESLSACSPRRRCEFSTSRSLVYRLLRAHGLPLPEALLAGQEGAPQWPPQVCGSISHCRGICSVAIAETSDCPMLGLDLEQLGRMKATVWSRIASGEELRLMHRWAEANGHGIDLAMTILFSIKEAFFKAQHPITGRWLGFLDVALGFSDETSFVVTAPVELPPYTVFAGICANHVLSAVLGGDLRRTK